MSFEQLLKVAYSSNHSGCGRSYDDVMRAEVVGWVACVAKAECSLGPTLRLMTCIVSPILGRRPHFVAFVRSILAAARFSVVLFSSSLSCNVVYVLKILNTSESKQSNA